MNIVIRLTAADGSSDLVVVEAGERFVIPAGVIAELVSFEGADDARVENGDLVLSGPEGQIRISGFAPEELDAIATTTASISAPGLDGPLPDGFLQLLNWSSLDGERDEGGANGASFGPNGFRSQDTGTGPDFESVSRTGDEEEVAEVSPPAIFGYSADTGIAGDRLTADATLTLRGTADPLAQVEIFDGGVSLGRVTASATGVWSFTTETLADGAHDFTVIATDAAGTVSAESDIYTVSIDTAAPETPVIATFSTDTGALLDGITADDTLTLTGAAEAGARVDVFDGGVLLGSATADGAGLWSFTTASLGDGAHSFTARATDAAGNASAVSDPLVVSIDATAPAAPLIAGYSDDTGASGDGITSDTTLVLTGTAEAGARIEIFDGATSLGTVTANGAGAWSFATAALADGAHSFSATATDAAGNVSAASHALVVTVDTAAPAAPVITGFASDTGVGGDGITADNTLTLSGTAEAGAAIEVFDGGVSLGTVTATGAGTWSFTTAALGDGAHIFTAQATDAAGNSGGLSGALGVTVDTSAPATPVITGWTDDTGAVGDGITSDNTLTFTGTAEAGAIIELFDGATSLGTVTADGTGAWTFVTGAQADGTHSYSVTATDVAGNSNGIASAPLIINVDTSAPAAPVITGYSDDTGAAGDGITRDTTLVLTGTAEAGAQIEIFDGATSLGTATVTGAGTWSFTTAALTDGAHSFTAVATDAAGSTGPASAALAVTVDSAAPAAPIITSISDDAGVVSGATNDTTLTLAGTAEAGATITILRGGLAITTTTADGAGNWSVTTPANPDGVFTFTAQAQDAAGNTSTPSAGVAVQIDTAAPGTPVITGYSADTGVSNSDDLTNDRQLLLSGTAEAGATVVVYANGAEIGTAFAGGGAWSFSTPVLADGDYTFTVMARDSAGNESGVSVGLDVTVDGTAPAAPVITGYADDTGSSDFRTSDNTLVFSGTAEAGATVNVYLGASLVATGVADGAGNWATAASGVIADGFHTFFARATDAAGNQSLPSGGFVVEVDTTPPPAPAITGYTNDNGLDGNDGISSFNWTTLSGTAVAGTRSVIIYQDDVEVATALVNAGVWQVTVTGIAEGAHVFTATGVDFTGNEGAASAGVAFTVDRTPPAVPTITAIADDTGVAGDFRTSDTDITLSGTAEANALVTVRVGATPVGTVQADGAGNWSFATGVLTEGAHVFTVKATDAAGLESSYSGSQIIVIDTTAPAAPVITGFSDNSGSAGDTITNDTTPTLSGTAAANTSVEIFRDEVSVGTTTADGSGDWSFTSAALGSGSYVFTARATDNVGNTGAASAGYTITVDTVPTAAPVITGFTPDTGTNGDGITRFGNVTLSGTNAADAREIIIYDNGTEIGRVTPVGTAWSFAANGLSESAHSFTAVAVDAAGNESAASATFGVTVDATAPAAPVITGYADDTGSSDFRTSDNTLVFSGTAEAGATVNVYLGATIVATGVADGAGNWTTAASGVIADGYHTFFARATDAAGNQGMPSGGFVVQVDTVPPPAPAITGYTNDNGLDSNDGISTQTWTTLSGTAVAGTRSVIIYQDGVEVATALVNAGLWQVTVTGIPEGAHVFTATGLDFTGNESVPSAGINFTVDLTAPAVPVITAITDDTGVAGDFRTSDTEITLSGTAEANAQVTVRDGVTVLGTVQADGAGNWSFVTGVLTEGVHSITVRATDAAGRTSPYSSAQNVVIDTTAPAAPVITGFSDDSGVLGDGITNDDTPTLSGTGPANTSIEIFQDGVSVGTTTSDGTGNWSFTSAALGEATYSFTARATDSVGNVSGPSAALDITIDLGPPPATATPSITGYSTDTGAGGDGITSDTTLTFTGTAVANASVEIFDGATSLGTVTATGAGTWTFTTGVLSETSHSFTVVATAAGFSASAASAPLAVTVDATAPGAATITGFSDNTGLLSYATSDNTVTLTGMAEANSTVRILNGGGLMDTVTADGTGAWTYTTNPLADGFYYFGVQAVDAAGNVGSASSVTAVQVDTTAPAAPVVVDFSSDTGVQNDGITRSNQIQISGTAQGGTRQVIIYDNGVEIGTTNIGGTSWSFQTNVLSEGTHSFTAVAVDGAGNQGALSTALPVTIDLTPPAAPSITGFTDTGIANGQTSDVRPTFTGTAEAGVTVRLFRGATEIASTVADGSGNWSATPTSDLPEGFYSVTARAYDAADNGSAPDQITVWIDTTPPEAPVVSGFTTNTGNGADNITSDTTPTFTGTRPGGTLIEVFDGATLIGTVPMTGTSWSFTSAPLADGTHLLSFVAVDGAGNRSATTNFSITIDNTPPVTTITGLDTDPGVQDGITGDTTPTITGTSEPLGTVNIYRDGGFVQTVLADGSGNWQFTDGALATGTYSYTARSTDAAGNTGATSGAFVVGIADAPELGPAPARLDYTVGDAPGVLHSFIELTDNAGTGFSGATIRILDGIAGDVLSITDMGGFTGSWDPNTYTITITGNGSLADLQAMIRSTTYHSTSNDPGVGGTDGSRQAHITVFQDGTDIPSDPLLAQVAVFGVSGFVHIGDDSTEQIVLTTTDIGRIVGGNGPATSIDVIDFQGFSNLTLDFTTVAPNAVREIERIDLVNGTNNLVLTAQDVLEMSNNVVSGQTRLAVLADSDNSVTTADGGWAAAGQTNYLGQDYNVFNNGNAQLLLHVSADASGIVA
mgnify:FL=1